jgi:hypothetical protein
MLYPIILLIAGLVFFLLAELGSMAQLRVFAVLLLIAGAAGMGMLAGSAPPGTRAERTLVGVIRSSAAVIAVMLAAPMLAVLVLSLLQALLPAASSAQHAGGGWRVAATLAATLLLAAAAAALVVALRTIGAASPGEKPAEAP